MILETDLELGPLGWFQRWPDGSEVGPMHNSFETGATVL